jgi:hypothetical protein
MSRVAHKAGGGTELSSSHAEYGWSLEQVPLAVRTTLMHTLALSRFRSPALFSVCGSGTEHAAGPTKELATRVRSPPVIPPPIPRPSIRVCGLVLLTP